MPDSETNNTKSTNFDFVTPTEIVDLPSKGLFYPEGHPLHGEESLEIRFMTAKDEDTLTSPSLLQKGIALDRLLSDVVLNNKINPKALLPCDRNALLIAARITGYGNLYETDWTCPSCGAQNQGSFDVGNHEVDFPDQEKLDSLGVRSEDGVYKFDIEGLGVEIGIKLLSYEEEAAVSDAARRRIEIGLTENITTDTLKAIIVSVNGVDDSRIINHVVDQMPVKDSRKIRKINSLITPRLKLEGEVTCAKCSETTVLEVPFTTGFFWPEL
jgi:hypothetical protein